MKILALIIWFIFVGVTTNKSYAGIIIGLQLADLRPSDYEYVDNNYNVNNIRPTFGVFKKSGNLSYTLSTNRLTNSRFKRLIRVSDNHYQSITKITIDTMGIAYNYRRYMAGYNVSRVNLNNRIIINEKKDENYKKISFANSVSVGYYINPNALIALTGISANEELKIDNSFIMSINLLF